MWESISQKVKSDSRSNECEKNEIKLIQDKMYDKKSYKVMTICIKPF